VQIEPIDNVVVLAFEKLLASTAESIDFMPLH
jgi:hypothetical protein